LSIRSVEISTAALTRRRASVVIGVALACLLAPLPAASAQTPVEVVSPLSGTLDANPHTQVSFLGAPLAQLHNVTVIGSRSGRHSGRLLAYSTGSGASFLPTRPFLPGEHVTVTATLLAGIIATHIGTSFAVSAPYTLPASGAGTPVPVTKTNVMRFHSRHDLLPPAVTVSTPAASPALGDVFISPDSGPGQNGPMILAPNGNLVWFDALAPGLSAFDLNEQTYRGAPVLTWWQGHVVQGHGEGVDMIESSHYTPIATVRAGNGLQADLHDFELTAQGTAWITAFAPAHFDLSAVGGPRNGLVDDGVVQEIDVRTGLVMFEWDALSHVALADTYMPIPKSSSGVLDFFHINSIDPLPDGELLISARNTWTTYLINTATGAIDWRLGGKHSTFTLGSGVAFAWQHDAQQLPDGTISLFDNEASPGEATQSRVIDIALDQRAHTATLVRQLTHPGEAILSDSQGDAQLLPNGDNFVGWGQPGAVSELSASGQLTFELRLATPAGTYRAFRYAWLGQPTTRPALAVAAPAGGHTELYASWNGATDVASWRVLAGASSRALRSVLVKPAAGFETAIAAPTTLRFIRVDALSASGAVLGSSVVARHR
jgi:hypothetical protein